MFGRELIRCICKNGTPDGMFNIPCDSCGYFIHGVCYQIRKGPITCVRCLGDNNDKPVDENVELSCLSKRLSLSLSQGEHRYFFGEECSNNVGSVYLQLKYNITPHYAKQILDVSIEKQLLILLPDGLFQHNTDLQGDNDFDNLNDLNLKHESRDNIPHERKNDIGDFVKSEPELEPPSHFDADTDVVIDQDEIENRDISIPDIKLEATDENLELLTKTDEDLPNGEHDLDDHLESGEESDQESKKKNETSSHPCSECDFVGTAPSRLRQHKNTVHKKKKVKGHKCPQCDFEAPKRLELRKHLKRVHDAIRYNCVECDASFRNSSGLKQHIRSIHEGIRYKCDQCNNNYSTPQQLKTHVKHVHEGVVFICDQCSHQCSCKRKLNEHKRRRHPEIYAAQIKADIKEENGGDSVDLQQKLLSVYEVKKYNCDQCGVSLSSRESLKNHVKQVHEGLRYYCDQCDKDYSQPGYLKEHIKTVHEGVMYKCDQCPYQVAYKYTLIDHKKSKHEGIRYPCDLCTYQAPSKKALVSHKKQIHSGIRFPCDICSYTASTAAAVKMHKEVKHEGKVYPCNQCNYSSPFKYKTNQHILTQHEGVRYTCDLCSYKTAHAGEVLKHKRKAHKELFQQ